MAFQGGPVPLVSISPSFINSSSSPLTSTYDPQVYQGMGQAFPGKPGQAMTGVLAASALNIGLNQALGNSVTGFSGIPLTTGSNVNATTLTRFVPGTLSNGVNNNILSTLTSAGAFGPAFSQGFSTGANLTGSGVGGFLGSVTGIATGALWGLLAFPGGGGEPASQYNNGVPYTLTTGGSDVQFSIQPANQGPQLFGQANGLVDPKAPTTLAFGQYTGTPPTYAGLTNDQLNADKVKEMGLKSISNDQDPIKEFSQYWKPESANTFTDPKFSANEKLLGTGAAGNEGWTFITAPEEITWDTANEVNRVAMFGTNNPPVISGTAGMRDLTLGNALVEGFIRNVNVEAKVLALEKLMDFTLNNEAGYVNVPVYQIWANNKTYGGNGYYVIKDVKIKETMRDLRGKSTRAYVDISLMEVPEYQVSDGRDQASNASAAAGGSLSATQQANQNISKTNWSGVAAANPQFANPSFSAGSNSGLSSLSTSSGLKRR